jgi:DNA repair photolyase
VTTRVALLSREQIDQLPERAREAVEYRKSGLSLNHMQGCPLDCAYCILHTYGLWDHQPGAPWGRTGHRVEHVGIGEEPVNGRA